RAERRYKILSAQLDYARDRLAEIEAVDDRRAAEREVADAVEDYQTTHRALVAAVGALGDVLATHHAAAEALDRLQLPGSAANRSPSCPCHFARPSRPGACARHARGDGPPARGARRR